MQKNAFPEPVTRKSFQQQQRDFPAAAATTRRQLPDSAAALSPRTTSLSIHNAMESDIRQPRLHQHRLSLGHMPQEDSSGAYTTRGPTQQSSHSRSSSGNMYSTSGGGSPISYGGNQGRGGAQRENTGGGGGGSDSNSSSGGMQGGGGGDQKAMESERGRLNQLMTNFFLKLALVVVRSRMDVPPVFTRGTANRKINKWFNVELEETDIFKEDLRLWKYSDASENRPPTLIIETYLDAEDLTPNQTLVILDELEKRHNVETTLLAFRNWRRGNPLNSKKEVVLERWRVNLSPPTGESAPELAVVYKKSIVLFRSLYSYARLLPSWKLQKKLAKGTKSSLRLCCRVMNGDTTPIPHPDPLEIALIPRETNVTNSFQFGAVESPAGTFTVKVDYRRQCEFRVDDSEALLSSHFLNLDEHYFKPSLHHRTGSQPVNLVSREPGSLPSNAAVIAQRGDPSLAYGSLTSFHQAGVASQSPISAIRNIHLSGGSSAGSPSEAASIPTRSAQGSKASLRSESGVQRRPSVSFMQPFKSPSLSASPSPADQYGPSPRTSLQRVPQAGVAVPARQRPATGTMSPSSLKSSIPAEGPTSNPAVERPTSVGRYSSSFGNRRPRHSSGASKTEDDNNSSGRGSLASAPGSGFVETSGNNSGLSEEDRSLTDFMNMLDQKQPLKIFDSFSESSGRRAVAALGKYQKMKDSNAALQDSMSSSLLLPTQSTSNPSSVGRTQPGGPPALSGASVSTSSSPGKPISPHTPAIPSRLVQNETIVHDQTNEPSSLDEMVAQIPPSTYTYRRRDTQPEGEATPSMQTTSTTATTSPMNIPSSPRFVQIRRSNSVSHEASEEDASGRFQSLRRVFGPEERHSTSLDSMDRPAPFLLAGDSLTTNPSPAVPPPESTARQQAVAATVSLSSVSPEQPRVASSSSDRLPTSSFGNRRPYRSSGGTTRATATAAVVGGRTPSENRGMFPLDDELLFDFSDREIAQRRSLDRGRGSGGDARGGGTRGA
ncbi:autophagy protein 13 [Orbilia brochopaga]